MSRPLQRLVKRLRKRPAPQALVALYLSWRWGCQVSPRARIDWPGNLTLGRRARLHACRITARGPVVLGDRVSVQDFTILDTEDGSGSIEIGEGTTMGPFTAIFGGGSVVIGRGCMIAGHSMIISTDHVSTDSRRPIHTQGIRRQRTRIDDDVWIGAQCTVLAGAVIGTGTMIGANSVVQGTIPPGVVVSGTPARVIRHRSAGDPAPETLDVA